MKRTPRKPPVFVRCPVCGTEFPRIANQQRWCSRECLRFLKITCDRCSKDRMLNEAQAPARQREMPIRVLLARARHDGCGGRAGRAELLTGIDGASNQPVRRIVLRAG